MRRRPSPVKNEGNFLFGFFIAELFPPSFHLPKFSFTPFLFFWQTPSYVFHHFLCHLSKDGSSHDEFLTDKKRNELQVSTVTPRYIASMESTQESGLKNQLQYCFSYFILRKLQINYHDKLFFLTLHQA